MSDFSLEKNFGDDVIRVSDIIERHADLAAERGNEIDNWKEHYEAMSDMDGLTDEDYRLTLEDIEDDAIREWKRRFPSVEKELTLLDELLGSLAGYGTVNDVEWCGAFCPSIIICDSFLPNYAAVRGIEGKDNPDDWRSRFGKVFLEGLDGARLLYWYHS